MDREKLRKKIFNHFGRLVKVIDIENNKHLGMLDSWIGADVSNINKDGIVIISCNDKTQILYEDEIQSVSYQLSIRDEFFASHGMEQDEFYLEMQKDREKAMSNTIGKFFESRANTREKAQTALEDAIDTQKREALKQIQNQAISLIKSTFSDFNIIGGSSYYSEPMLTIQSPSEEAFIDLIFSEVIEMSFDYYRASYTYNKPENSCNELYYDEYDWLPDIDELISDIRSIVRLELLLLSIGTEKQLLYSGLVSTADHGLNLKDILENDISMPNALEKCIC